MNKIIDAINQSTWADRTKKNRILLINALKRDLKQDNFNFLKDFNLVSKYLIHSTSNPTTLKTKILTIKSILQLVDDKASKKYENLVHTIIDDAEEYKGNNVVKDKDNWITYEEMLEIPYIILSNIKFIYKDLFLDVSDIDNLKTIKGKHKYLRNLTDFIISILYCWVAPVRADWATVLLNKPSKDKNYYDSNKGIIYWNDFKNVKSFGKQAFKLDSNINHYINEYISILSYIIDSPKYLLYIVGSNDVKAFSREKFSVYFIRIMKYYTNKKLSINTFRHVFEQHIITDPDYNKLTINQKKSIHNQLLHSWKTSYEYLKVD